MSLPVDEASGVELVVVCSFCFLQDTKKGKLRFYHGPIFWNYGYIPQTWEDPTVKHPEASHARSEEDVLRPIKELQQRASTLGASEMLAESVCPM